MYLANLADCPKNAANTQHVIGNLSYFQIVKAIIWLWLTVERYEHDYK